MQSISAHEQCIGNLLCTTIALTSQGQEEINRLLRKWAVEGFVKGHQNVVQ